MAVGVCGIKSLGRYSLSIVLCHLEEHEATSLLITTKRFSRRILPLFRLQGRLLVKGSKQRHKFIQYPAQDPEVLLQRLNTHRLRKIIRYRPGHECYDYNKTTEELALQCRGSLKLPASIELLRFLSSKESWNDTTLLVSYPRSGNTLVRNLVEQVSGIVTGSDNRPDRKLSRDLAVRYGLVGEGVTQRVKLVKTHYPERTGFRLEAKRAILLVRNPFDAIDSYWNLNLTNTHTETVTDEIYHQYRKTFEDFSRNEMKVWLQFHRYWLDAKVPVLLIRFEDLISNMEEEMKRITAFLEIKNVRGSKHGWTDYLSQAGSYRPRTSGKTLFGKSLEKSRYSDELINSFHEIASESEGWEHKSILQYFGYDIKTQGFPNNFLDPNVLSVPSGPSARQADSILINTGYQLRKPSDIYGRSMKNWRLSQTNNDENPFQIIERKND